MKKIKLWISDIDGTLMNYDGSVTERMQNLIKKINSSDIKLVLATGRMFMGAYHAAKSFNNTNPVVCYQGAVVRTKDEILWQSTIKDELVLEILDYLKQNDVHTHLYFNDTLYVEDDNKQIMNVYCNGRGTVYEVVDDFKALKPHSIPKILGVIEEKNKMERIKHELSEKYVDELTIVQSSSCYLEITNKGVSKGLALEFLKKYWNLSDDEVLATGDQDNDIELIKHAGHSACVGFNSEELRRIAKYKIESVNSDGLVDLVERLAF